MMQAFAQFLAIVYVALAPMINISKIFLALVAIIMLTLTLVIVLSRWSRI